VLLYLAISPRITPWPYEHFLFQGRGIRALTDESLFEGLKAPQFSGVKMMDETWQTAHGELHVVRLLNENAPIDVVVMISQGIAGNIAGHLPLLELLVKSGVREVVIYEPRGFGHSHFSPWSAARIPTYFGGMEHVSLRSITQDARDIHALVSEMHSGQSRPVIWWGESFGASVVAYLATHEDGGVQGIILQGGFKSLADIGYDKHLPGFWINPCYLYPRWLYPPEFNTGLWLSGQHPSALVIHGAHDSIVPFQHSIDVAQSATSPCQLVVLTHSLHVDLQQGDEILVVDSVKGFMRSLTCQR
jgi:pimeloyl-ACP methyl ester carboxylesterase